MRLVWVAGMVGVTAMAAIVRPDIAWNVYESLYPSDPAQRHALDQCFLEDHRFDRFDPAAREACYRRAAQARQVAARDAEPARPLPPQANFVDQWRAAGLAHVPHNDIRVEQQNDRYIHPAARAGR